ncbi:MAG: class I SAM-dependent methyltransferase [Myxococcota bacterium]|nr:class I SAM-dependent methyltransferase [Myxococcota bacterium]
MARLMSPVERSREIGPLWHLAEGLQFIRENVDPQLLRLDFEALPQARELWTTFTRREAEVGAALTAAVASVAAAFRRGEWAPDAFRSSWEALGFAPHEEGGGTPADDYLDALCQVSRLTLGEPRPPAGNLNMASRAQQIAEFLEMTRPGPADLVIDLGSGSGKLALTVAASSLARVRGIEYGKSYVAAARRSADFLGLQNLAFVHADVRDVELSEGTIFFLYYPFHGEVARAVAQTLGRLGEGRQITLCLRGPSNDFADHFLAQGSLSVVERRGEFSETLVLRSG